MTRTLGVPYPLDLIPITAGDIFANYCILQ